MKQEKEDLKRCKDCDKILFHQKRKKQIYCTNCGMRIRSKAWRDKIKNESIKEIL